MAASPRSSSTAPLIGSLMSKRNAGLLVTPKRAVFRPYVFHQILLPQPLKSDTDPNRPPSGGFLHLRATGQALRPARLNALLPTKGRKRPRADFGLYDRCCIAASSKLTLARRPILAASRSHFCRSRTWQRLYSSVFSTVGFRRPLPLKSITGF